MEEFKISNSEDIEFSELKKYHKNKIIEFASKKYKYFQKDAEFGGQI